MGRISTSIAILFFAVIAFGQKPYVHQVIFLNEGWYDFVNGQLVIPPSVGSYNMTSGVYTVFDEIPESEFASDVLVDDVIYVAADNHLITYDKNTLERLQVAEITGIRKMAMWNDQLLISRGDYLVTFDSYFQVYDKHTLSLLYSLDTQHGPQYASEGIVVDGDMAYLAINNGFVFGEEVGIVGMVDLQTRKYAGEIDLGPTGINPDNIMLGNDRIYTLNNKDYTSSSISTINQEDLSVATADQIAANSGCGTSVLADAHIYYMEYGVDKLARYNVETAEIVDTLSGSAAYYGLIDDEINAQLIATLTDFFSTGTAYFLDYNGNVLKTFEVGVSPGNIALDVRIQPAAEGVFAIVSPNPTQDMLTITAEDDIRAIAVMDTYGRTLQESTPGGYVTTVSIGGYPTGVYFIEVTLTGGGHHTYRVVKA